jgi:hypothetical protein
MLACYTDILLDCKIARQAICLTVGLLTAGLLEISSSILLAC